MEIGKTKRIVIKFSKEEVDDLRKVSRMIFDLIHDLHYQNDLEFECYTGSNTFTYSLDDLGRVAYVLDALHYSEHLIHEEEDK